MAGNDFCNPVSGKMWRFHVLCPFAIGDRRFAFGTSTRNTPFESLQIFAYYPYASIDDNEMYYVYAPLSELSRWAVKLRAHKSRLTLFLIYEVTYCRNYMTPGVRKVFTNKEKNRSSAYQATRSARFCRRPSQYADLEGDFLFDTTNLLFQFTSQLSNAEANLTANASDQLATYHTLAEHEREVAASAVAFHIVSESSGGPPLRYPIPF
ncbi:hypothetical protein EVAR_7339_1 [Eumeta japonica]|uniref:Uncharacterized protein n=1 Tax=Eumeta variegata TaxID=151549 RepID=A0A4C1T5B9_EUMVA|nr:hypothetical protein EVAR_7339_1 [Eumeta japonica]